MRLIYPVVALVGIFALSGCSHTSTKASRSQSASKNYGLTFEQVREAAQDGDADAQYALGYMYYYGQNVTRSGKQARFWIGRAAAQNHKQASKALKMMEAEPSYAQRETGSDRVAQAGPAREWGSGQNSWQEVRGQSETKNQPKQLTSQASFSDPKPRTKTSAPSAVNTEKKSKHPTIKAEKESKNLKKKQAHAKSDKKIKNNHKSKQLSQGLSQGIVAAQESQVSSRSSKSGSGHAQSQGSKLNAQPAEDDTLEGNAQLAQTETPEGDTEVLQPSANNKAKSAKGLKTSEAHQGKSPKTSAKAKQTESKKGNSALSSDERKILSKPNDHYTIQITGSSSKQTVQQFIAVNHLQKKAKIYHTKVKGKDFYGLIYGNYSSQAAANAGIARLPENIKELKPWAKSYAAIKGSINSANTH